jgi:TRAP-type mannitol/chloroaromatic compound transport system permease small subunit
MGEPGGSPYLDGLCKVQYDVEVGMATARADVPPRENPPRWMITLVTLIDTVIGEWSGRLFAWLVVPMVFGLCYEVFARYLFNAPTIWAYDVTYILYGSHFMLGAAYTLYKGQHIRTDIFYANFSVRWKGIVDAVLYLLFFFPGMILFMLAGWSETLQAWAINERSDASPWRPIIYPFKAVVPAAGFLLIIQGISEFLKSAYAAIKGRPL